MKTKKYSSQLKKTSTRTPLIIGTIILVVLGAFAAHTLYTRKHVNPPISGPTPQQKKQDAQTSADTKQKFIEEQSSQPPNPSTPGNATTPGTQSVELTAKQEDNNTVTIFTKLVGYSSGSCVLTITNGTQSYTKNAQVFYQPEYSSCAGFSVPISSLGKGTWSISLTTAQNGDAKNTSITYEVK